MQLPCLSTVSVDLDEMKLQLRPKGLSKGVMLVTWSGQFLSPNIQATVSAIMSSQPSPRVQRTSPVGPDGVVLCNHGEPALIRTSRTAVNPNRYVAELRVYHSTQTFVTAISGPVAVNLRTLLDARTFSVRHSNTALFAPIHISP